MLLRNLRNLESNKTRQLWLDTTSPMTWLVGVALANIVCLIATIIINIVSDANARDNDYSYNTGWAMTMPAPCVAFVWTLVDVAICRFWILHPIYSLVCSIFILTLYLAFGILTLLLFSWNGVVILVGVLMLANAIIYFIFMGHAARVIDKTKKGAKSEARMANLRA